VSEINPQEFGALQADVRTLTNEIHLLRQEMAGVNAAINQGKGGLWVVVMAAGAVSSMVTLAIKRIFGG
jgi:uncharacterized membrane protein